MSRGFDGLEIDDSVEEEVARRHGLKVISKEIQIRTCLVALDFILAHLQYEYLETDDDNVNVVKRLIHGKDIAGAFHEIRLDDLLARSVIIFCTFIPFFGFRELGRVLGKDKFRALVFGTGAVKSDPSPII